MHNNIFAHGAVDETTVDILRSVHSAFVAVDRGGPRKFVTGKLGEFGVPFIDVGMGIAEKDTSLFGTLRVTLSAGLSHDRIEALLPLADVDDAGIYSSTIQVADLNALNASLAVIKWKKFLGFYADLGAECSVYYQIPYNSLANEDQCSGSD